MISMTIMVSIDTAAKLHHEALRQKKSVEEVASSFFLEGVNTCEFLFLPRGANTPHPQTTEDSDEA